MDLSLGFFLEQVTASPVLAITVLLTLGVILVNGWTDAPNAIAGCIACRALSPRRALLLAGACNFAGAIGMSLLNTEVAR